jgi:hypothetical protein
MESLNDRQHSGNLPDDGFHHCKTPLLNLRYLKYQGNHNYFPAAEFFQGAVD